MANKKVEITVTTTGKPNATEFAKHILRTLKQRELPRKGTDTNGKKQG